MTVHRSRPSMTARRFAGMFILAQTAIAAAAFVGVCRAADAIEATQYIIASSLLSLALSASYAVTDYLMPHPAGSIITGPTVAPAAVPPDIGNTIAKEADRLRRDYRR